MALSVFFFLRRYNIRGSAYPKSHFAIFSRFHSHYSREGAGTGKRERSEDDVRFLIISVKRLKKKIKKTVCFSLLSSYPNSTFLSQSFLAFKIKDGDCRKILKILDNSFEPARLTPGQNRPLVPFVDEIVDDCRPFVLVFGKTAGHQPGSGYCYLRSSENSKLSLTRKIRLWNTG